MEIILAKLRLQLSKNEEEQNINPTQYRRLIGSLWYLHNMRPNLEFSVGIVSRFMGIPNASHLATAKRTLRYIKGSIGCRVLFLATCKGRSFKLFGYADSNLYGDKDDRKPIIRYIFMYE